VTASSTDLPVRLDRGIAHGRDYHVARAEWCGDGLEPGLAAELREGPVGLRARAVGIQPRRSRVRVGPVGTAAGVEHRPAEGLDECLVHFAALQRRKGSKIDASTGLDVRDGESGERVPDDDRVRLWPDLAGMVERG
jgi:hypothetical protein